MSGKFFTDSNGRRLLKRQKNESIERSYYPITSAAVLKDDTHRVTVLTDRAQGAASWLDGTIEIMVSYHKAESSHINKKALISDEDIFRY